MVEKYEKMNIMGGNVNVYTGPKDGKFYMNRSGKKVYLKRDMLEKKVSYNKGKGNKKK
jgi:hypothetical protein